MSTWRRPGCGGRRMVRPWRWCWWSTDGRRLGSRHCCHARLRHRGCTAPSTRSSPAEPARQRCAACSRGRWRAAICGRSCARARRCRGSARRRRWRRGLIRRAGGPSIRRLSAPCAGRCSRSRRRDHADDAHDPDDADHPDEAAATRLPAGPDRGAARDLPARERRLGAASSARRRRSCPRTSSASGGSRSPRARRRAGGHGRSMAPRSLIGQSLRTAADRRLSAAPDPPARTAAIHFARLVSRRCPTAYTPRCTSWSRAAASRFVIARSPRPSAASCWRLMTPSCSVATRAICSPSHRRLASGPYGA